MGTLAGLNALFERAKSALIKDSETTVDSAQVASTQLREYFDRAVNAEAGSAGLVGDIDEMLDNVHSKTAEFSGARPSMGLVTPEVEAAEKNMDLAEVEAEENNLDAEGSLDEATLLAQDNNAIAESELNDTEQVVADNDEQARLATENAEEVAVANNAEAENNLEIVEADSQARIDDAQSQVNSAESQQSSAQSSLDSAQSSVVSAESNLASAESAVSAAQTEEEQDRVDEQVEQAQLALEQAQEVEQEAEAALEEANVALEETQTALEDTETKAHQAIQGAEEKLASTEDSGAEQIRVAQENELNVEAQGQQDIEKAELNLSEVEAAGERSINGANENLEKTRVEGEQAVNDANEEVKQAHLDSQAYFILKEQERYAQEGQEVAQKLKDDISGFGPGNVIEDVYQKIDSQNVTSVLEAYSNLTENSSDKETLTEAICDEISLRDDIKAGLLTDIKDKLQERSKQLGLDTSDLNSQFDGLVNDVTDSTMRYVSNNEIKKLDDIFNQYSERIKAEEARMLGAADNLRLDLNDVNSRGLAVPEKVKATANELFDLYGQRYNIKSNDFLGNGAFDTPSKQMTGNCWLHGSINAMTATSEGAEKVNNLVHASNGNITAVIPEARVNGASNGGVYTYNTFDLVDNFSRHSLGDGDMTAYSMATEEYLRSIGEKDSVEGNRSSRGFELISGDKANLFEDGNVPMGAGFAEKINSRTYRSMESILTSGKGAFTTDFEASCSQINNATLVNHNYDPIPGTPFLSDFHEYAVKKVDSDYIYLQESNNPSSYIKMPKEEYLKHADGISSYRW